MRNLARTLALGFIVVLTSIFGLGTGQAAEQRFALVIGNDDYKAAKLATSANDAGLVADALQAAGFTVTGARNLDQATLRESFREFLGQVSAAGPDAVAGTQIGLTAPDGSTRWFRSPRSPIRSSSTTITRRSSCRSLRTAN